MWFLDPWRLALLAGVALLVVLYVRGVRRPATYSATLPTARFAALATQRAGRRWRRHLAPAAFLVALALLVGGFARPAVNVRVATTTADVVVALDTSLSMYADDVPPSRLTAAREAAVTFVEQLPEQGRVGLVTFDGTAALVVAPTTDHSAVIDALERTPQAQDGTAIGDAVATAGEALDRLRAADAGVREGGPAPSSMRIVLLSDGDSNAGRPVETAAARLVEQRITVDTIAFGTEDGFIVINGRTIPAPVATNSLADLAQITGGQPYEAESAGALGEAYADVAADVGSREEPREVTGWAGAAAAAALVLAVLLAFLRMRRPARR